MAKTISDAQTSLAYRLGENSAPTSASEKAKRLNWFKKALEYALIDRPLWFTETTGWDESEADINDYSFPSDCRQIIRIKVDGYEHDKVPFDEVYQRFEVPTSPVPILPSYMKRVYYLLNDKFYLIPMPDSAPTADAVSSITSSGVTCTVTMAAEHGYTNDNYVTISGAVETAYNGKFRISVTGATTFTYTALTTPSATPATGTIISTKSNIEITYYQNPTLPTGDTSGIVVPDNFEDLLVSYAEARYWSAAHKRGKSSDAFTEFETWVEKIQKEHARRSFGLS